MLNRETIVKEHADYIKNSINLGIDISKESENTVKLITGYEIKYKDGVSCKYKLGPRSYNKILKTLPAVSIRYILFLLEGKEEFEKCKLINDFLEKNNKTSC